jgi:hypothetical protein
MIWINWAGVQPWRGTDPKRLKPGPEQRLLPPLPRARIHDD